MLNELEQFQGNGNGHGILIPGRPEAQPDGLVVPPRYHHQQTVEGIRKNAEIAKDWEYQEIWAFLDSWTPILVSELVDPILTPDRENRPLPPPVISFEKYDYRILAGYRLTRNAQGLLDQITFNTAHIKVEEVKSSGRKFHSTWEYGDWFLLETYTHELLHLKQQNFGKHPVDRNYHNAEFIGWAEQIGLHVNQDGQHTRLSDRAFAACMARHGIALPPEMPEDGWGQIADFLKWLEFLDGKEKKKGRSTLTLYECPCGQKVRVGRKDWPGAVCKACGEEYAKIEGKEAGGKAK